MRRPSLNFIVDSIALTGFTLLASTGTIMHFVLPPGQGHGSTIWGLGRHDWGAVHFWIAVIFLSTIALHFILHWPWISIMVKGRKRFSTNVTRRMTVGLVSAVVLLVIAVAPVVSPKISTEEVLEPGMQEETNRPLNNQFIEPQDIRGSLTLKEVEEMAGVPAEHVIRSLRLPPDTPTDKPLRDLHNRLNFTMEEVRMIVEKYRQSH